DDARVPQPRRELRLAAEALGHGGIGGERRVEDLDRHVALEPEVARPIHPPESARADFLEQLVIVSQGAPQPSLEARLRQLRRPRRSPARLDLRRAPPARRRRLPPPAPRGGHWGDTSWRSAGP